ncbi:MAG TPA: glycosyltransferase family 2 protein [Xanthobacteraceae bacterium]
MMRGTANGIATPAVSIVVPVRNEAGNVGPLISEIVDRLDKVASFEIIYVNDGSTDGTESALTELMANRPWLRQIKHQRSCGQSAAIHTGVRHARAPVVVTLDGDGQNDPAFIPPLLAALSSGAPRIALVAGQRVGRQATAFKKLQSRIANRVRGAVLRDGTRDTGCGLKAFRRDLFLGLPYFDGLHRFLPALVRREGYEIGYVDVIDRPRHSGRSNYGMWDRLWVGILDLIGVWWLIRRRRRVPQVVEVKRNAG